MSQHNHKTLCDGLEEKVSCEEETDRASLKHRNVEFRIAQDGAGLNLLETVIKKKKRVSI